MKFVGSVFIFFISFLAPLNNLWAQVNVPATIKGHAHNDYEINIPFTQAYKLGFASIEVDVLLINDTLFVAHDAKHIQPNLRLENAYLQPLSENILKNNGSAYSDVGKNLILLIDLKTEALSTLEAVIKAIENLPVLKTCKSLQLVITGNQPSAKTFAKYPPYIFFDGDITNPAHIESIDNIALFSASFRKFSQWNGKGVIPASELSKLKLAIDKAHHLHKPVRFWASPDNINTWHYFTGLGVDYINTDQIEAFTKFAATYKNSNSIAEETYELYKPKYQVDGDNTRVKNIILIIGDGTGLAQWYAGYTGNKGKLNVFNMRSIGLSITTAADSYITDSGAGATAMATGQKTNNRFIAVSPAGKPVQSLPEWIKARGMQTGIITTGNVTDATPAAFYSHVAERSESDSIAAQLLASNTPVLIGSGVAHFNQRKDGRNLLKELQTRQFSVLENYKNLDTVSQPKVLVLDNTASMHAHEGRGDFLTTSLDFTIKKLAQNKNGFFIMAEGAQVDHGGHSNELNWLVEEVKDLDKAIGHALKFADENKETLVIVTADHETGGLSLLSGDIKSGAVGGHFSSDDHSGICVPVFAYGPQSRVFCGVYHNTEIFTKMKAVLSNSSPKK